MRRTIAERDDLFNALEHRIHFFDKEIETVFRQSEACQRIAKVKGIGPKTATAVVAAIGKGTEFKNGRHFAEWLGLVPRQHSSGDRQVLMNMAKKGDKHLRTLFIHGARAVVRVATNNNYGYINQLVSQLKRRRGFNKTTVAVANKNARIIWSMLRNETEYQAVGSLPSQKSCSVLRNGDRLHLYNRNLIFILAFEAVQLLRRLCADYPFGHRFS